jgi:hypothetical protein
MHLGSLNVLTIYLGRSDGRVDTVAFEALGYSRPEAEGGVMSIISTWKILPLKMGLNRQVEVQKICNRFCCRIVQRPGQFSGIVYCFPL